MGLVSTTPYFTAYICTAETVEQAEGMLGSMIARVVADADVAIVGLFGSFHVHWGSYCQTIVEGGNVGNERFVY
jgi:hypothetical protein